MPLISHTTPCLQPTVATKNDPSKDTLICFDWDDTILCSSFLASHGVKLDSPQEKVEQFRTQLDELSHSILTLLDAALQYGPITVVTNAETGWVQLSCQKFIPLVVPMLNRLTIISA